MVKNSSTGKNTKTTKVHSRTMDPKHELEGISSTTEIINKKINKSPKPSIRPSRSSKKHSFNNPSLFPEAYKCQEHHSNIEFICQLCLRELCGHCILKHTEHITNIIAIKDVMKEYLEESEDQMKSPETLLKEIRDVEKNTLKNIEETSRKVKDLINNFITNLEEKVERNHQEALDMVESLTELKETALNIVETNDYLHKNDIDLVKTYLNYNHKLTNNQNVLSPLTVSCDNLITEIENSLKSNFKFESYDTTFSGIPKYLHWFEWGKRKLNLYNIVTNTTHIIDLDIHFKIPSFSRSLILPNGHIYLLGGEEPEYISRREVYMYDTVANDRKLYPKAPMIYKKFDFTLAYLNGYIYVICGKDNTSEVVDTCERYSIQDNQWNSIAPVRKRRYAASAVGMSNNKIYLFGGRSDYNNTMVNEIEEYCAIKNEWNILFVRNSNLWNPVEVCACIQIKETEILIFGGSDAHIKDSTSSLIFNIRDYSFEKRGELKKPQVFVNAPFLYKDHVYALGNEYYMKHRNLHRFSLEKGEWEIIF
jgi:Uncharacterized protein conserved in bacteria